MRPTLLQMEVRGEVSAMTFAEYRFQTTYFEGAQLPILHPKTQARISLSGPWGEDMVRSSFAFSPRGGILCLFLENDLLGPWCLT